MMMMRARVGATTVQARNRRGRPIADVQIEDAEIFDGGNARS